MHGPKTGLVRSFHRFFTVVIQIYSRNQFLCTIGRQSSLINALSNSLDKPPPMYWSWYNKQVFILFFLEHCKGVFMFGG